MSRPILFALVLAALFSPAKLHAQTEDGQNSYGGFLYGGESEEEKKDPGIWQYQSKYKKGPQAAVKNLLPQGEQFLYFIRKPDTQSNEAVLRMVAPVTVNGCVNVMPPTVTMRRGGNMLVFKIQDGGVSIDKSVRYAHFQCHQGANAASADITLNRDEIIENNIRTVTFQIGQGATDTYQVELSGDTLTLYPKTSMAFKPFKNSARPDPLSYTFYPDSTVILYAPAAPKEADLSENVFKLAQGKGLAQIPGLKNKNAYYFNDQSGLISGSLDFGASAYVGTITAAETFQGANGPYEHAKQVDVYARKPGFAD